MKNIEIAKLLNVSTATVSLALNNKPGVSEETRQKILELKNASLREDVSRIVKEKPHGTIGLLIYKKRGDVIVETAPFFVDLMNAIDTGTSNSSFTLNIIYFTTGSLLENIENVNHSNLCGLMVIATEMSEEDAELFRKYLKIPYVFTDVAFPSSGTDCVLMNNRSGIVQAMDYAYSLGHRKIGFVNSLQVCNNFTERYSAFLSKCRELGICGDYVYNVGSTSEAARNGFLQILAGKPDLPTVLVAASDAIAMGVMEALKRSGLRIPEDISIVGFDDMPVVQYLTPSLTSVRLKNKRIASVAVARLIAKIEDPAERSYTLQQYVDVELIPRASVARIGESADGIK